MTPKEPPSRTGPTGDRKCGVCHNPIAKGEKSSSVLVTQRKGAPWGTRPGYPGFFYSMKFHARHGPSECTAAMKEADKFCESEALRTGAYVRWRL